MAHIAQLKREATFARLACLFGFRQFALRDIHQRDYPATFGKQKRVATDASRTVQCQARFAKLGATKSPCALKRSGSWRQRGIRALTVRAVPLDAGVVFP